MFEALITAAYVEGLYGLHSAWCARAKIAPMPRDFFAEGTARHLRAMGVLPSPSKFWTA